MEPRPRTAARAAALLLALVASVAFLVRAPAIGRLLPHSPEPDAYVVQLAQQYRGDPAIVELVDYAERYPVLLARTLALLPWPDARAVPREASRGSASAEDLLAGGAAPYAAGRWLVLALSLLAIPGTWLVARRLAGERVAWLAALLVATSFLHALFSTQARPHGPQAAFALFAAWAAMRWAERASAARGALAALFAALSLSTLQIGAATLPPLALAGWLAGGTRTRRALRAALLPLVALAASLWAYPFALRIDAYGLRLGGKGAHEIDWSHADFQGFARLGGWLASHDPVLCLLLAAGLASALVRWRASLGAIAHQRDVAVACGFALPYLAFVGPLDEVYERFLLPLLPWIATLGACVALRLCTPGPRWMFPAVAAGLLALPSTVLVRFAWVAARDDSAEIAARWISAQPDAASATVVGSPGLVLPLVWEAAALAEELQAPSARSSAWPRYLAALPAERLPPPRVRYRMAPAPLSLQPDGALRAWLEAARPAYLVLERTKKQASFPAARVLSEVAAERGRLVHRSQGMAPGIETLGLLHYQALSAPLPRLFAAERFGAPLEVWRLEW